VDELRATADRANRGIYAEFARRSGGSVTVDDGLVLVAGSHPSPVIANTAFRDLGAPGAAAGAPERIARHYRRIGHGVGLLTAVGPDDDLEEAAARSGWSPVIDLPVMTVTKPSEVGDPSVTIRPADAEADLEAFREVLAAGFTDDEDERGMLRSMFATPNSLASPGARAVLAFEGGVAVGAGAEYRFEGSAVVGWITVLESHRRRGIGAAITATLANDALRDGAGLVALQASSMGASVYRALGFREVGLDRIWRPPGAEHATG
jgi:GNAT superfamily N-acetyltransferase